jgi:methionine-rich copper-binding protein CopC
MRKLLTGSYAALLVLLVAAPAVAQAAPPQYQSSEPSDGATVHEPPDRIEVTFDQPLDEASNLTITDGCDRRIDDGATEVSGSSMSVALEQKPSGEYHVAYVARGIGGLTGTSDGHFTFTAHAGESCGKGGGAHHPGMNHPGNHDPGKGTENHGKHGNDHSGTDHSSTGHSSTDHSGTDHSTASGHDDGHSSGTGSSHDEQGAGHSNGNHSNGNHTTAAADDFDGITSSDTSRNLLTRANSTTLLISLFLCAALGILGGAVLRATNAK